MISFSILFTLVNIEYLFRQIKDKDENIVFIS